MNNLKETAFTIDSSSIKFGNGVTEEVGWEFKRLNCKNIMIITDENLIDHISVTKTIKSIEQNNLNPILFSDVSVEPTDSSFKQAIEFAEANNIDGFVGVGGGSSMDTAKAANLYSTYPADFMTYVNAPIGKGAPVPGKLKPMIAIPTTTGTGSETTGTAVFDYVEMNAKTAIAHRELRPLIGLIDPENVRTIPPNVVACSGLDVLCHGLESYTAIPFHARSKPETPGLRPSYQGSNPISDIWSLTAVKMVAENIYNAVNDPDNHEARSQMLLAATYAGIGFGNAGCHLCHGMSYAVSGNVKEFFLNDYPQDHPMIPHGLSVAITAPAIFNFTAKSDPKRHVDVTKALGISDVDENNVNIMLPRAIKDIMNSIGMPTKLSDLGYKESDVDELVKVTLPQHRVVKLSPIEVDGNDLKKLFIKSLDDSWIQ